MNVRHNIYDFMWFSNSNSEHKICSLSFYVGAEVWLSSYRDFKVFDHELRTWFFFLARTRLVMRPNGSPSCTISPSVASFGTPRKCKTLDGLPAWAASSFTCETNTRGLNVSQLLTDWWTHYVWWFFKPTKSQIRIAFFLIGMTVNDWALELKWTYDVYYFIGFACKKYLLTDVFENCIYFENWI